MKKRPLGEIVRGVAACAVLLLSAACSVATSPAPVTPTVTAIPTVTPASAPTVAAATAAVLPTPIPYEQAVHLFDYDSAMPLDVKEISVTDQDGIPVHDISYAAHDPHYGDPTPGRMSAYLVTPPGKGPFAGIVFMHWLGNPNGNRSEFLDQAVALAQQGAVSILVEGVFPWQQSPADYQADRLQVIGQVIELRRAIDLLLAQPGVDPQRIGFVGHDYGAMFGSVLSGVDHRVKAFVLMAGMGNFGDWSLKYWPATGSQGSDAYRAGMAEVDPIGYIGHAAPTTLFFQFAQNDQFISKETAQQFYAAASTPKQIQWYDTGHALNTDGDRGDRKAWLASQLGLAGAK